MRRLRRAWRAFITEPVIPKPEPDGARLVIVQGGVTATITLDRYDFEAGHALRPWRPGEGQLSGLLATDRDKYGPWGKVTGSYGPVPEVEA